MEKQATLMKTTAYRGIVWVAVILALPLVGCGGSRSTRSGEKVYLHQVEPGESLADVADDYYGDATRTKWIADFNSIDEDDVSAGTVLRIPMSAKDVERLKTRELARGPYNEGLSLAERGAYVDAIQRFRESLEIDANFVDAHYNLGVTFQKIKKYDKALDEFQDVVRLRPDKAEYHFALGTAYFYLNRYEESAAAFEEVMERDRSHSKALYSLAMSYEKLDRPEQAKKAWERYLELDGTSVWATEARKHLKDLD